MAHVSPFARVSRIATDWSMAWWEDRDFFFFFRREDVSSSSPPRPAARVQVPLVWKPSGRAEVRRLCSGAQSHIIPPPEPPDVLLPQSRPVAATLPRTPSESQPFGEPTLTSHVGVLPPPSPAQNRFAPHLVWLIQGDYSPKIVFWIHLFVTLHWLYSRH